MDNLIYYYPIGELPAKSGKKEEGAGEEAKTEGKY